MDKNIATLIAFLVAFILGVVFGVLNAFMSGQAISPITTLIMATVVGVIGALVVRVNAFKE